MTRQQKTIFAASLFSTSGAIIYLISPILLGSAMESMNLSSSQGGLMLTLYFAGYTAITVSAAFWLHRTNTRRVALWSLLGFIAGLIFAAFSDTFAMLSAAMVVSGAGAGMLYGLSIATIADSDDPDRYFGIALAAQLALGSILLFLGPSFLGPRWGFCGIMIGTAIFVAILGLSLPWMPTTLARGVSPAQKQKTQTTIVPVVAAIGALLIWFTGFSGLYAFVERIGADSGLSGLTIGTILSLTVITGVTGALGAAAIGDRYGRLRPHIAGAAGTFLAMFLLSGNPGLTQYAIAIAFLTLSWNFWLAYLLGTIASADFSGRFAVLTTAALGLGATLGPGIAGGLVDGGYTALFVFSGVTIMAGLLVALWTLARLKALGTTRAASAIASMEHQ